jgi:hypothetical protein
MIRVPWTTRLLAACGRPMEKFLKYMEYDLSRTLKYTMILFFKKKNQIDILTVTAIGGHPKSPVMHVFHELMF